MTSTLHMILGSTSAEEHLRVIRRNRWGRMWVGTKHPIRPYPGERWGFDNGAFVAWRRGDAWDEGAFLRSLDRAHGVGTPYLAVIPDRVGAGRESLDFSSKWLDRLPSDWPWYLALQDGMTAEDVRPILPRVAGLFLGGTDAFKATAPPWADLAHAAGKRFHYGRAGTMRKLMLARLAHADSADSVMPIWKAERREQLVRWWSGGECQLLIPWR